MSKSPTIPVYDSSVKVFPAIEELHEIMRYRNLIIQMVRRDVVTRYKRSVLGIAWTMLNPLGTTLVLAIVFSRVFGRTAQGYPAYLLAGLVAWTFFTQVTNAAMRGLLWGGSLVTRIYLPKTVFAITAVGNGLVNLVLSIPPLIIVMFMVKLYPTAAILLLPVPILFLSMFSLGMGLLLSTFATRFADIAEMYGIILTAWMYMTPIIYREDIIPEKFQWLMTYNPMYYLIHLFRVPTYFGRLPTWNELLVAGSIATVTLLFGWILFTYNKDKLSYLV